MGFHFLEHGSLSPVQTAAHFASRWWCLQSERAGKSDSEDEVRLSELGRIHLRMTYSLYPMSWPLKNL